MAEEPDLESQLAAVHAACWGWALACAGRDRDRASDVLQEAYARVLERRARWDGRSSFKTWLFGVVRMIALEERRFAALRFLRARAPLDPSAAPPSARAPDSELGARERAKALEEALRALPERQRQVLHLAFYEGLSLAEAAEVMGISTGTASQHYDRGKAALAARLAREAQVRR